jgi:hypothetical protein
LFPSKPSKDDIVTISTFYLRQAVRSKMAVTLLFF